MSNNKGEPKQKDLIKATHDTVMILKTVLLGVPNTDDRGLVGEVKEVKLNMNNLYGKHRKLSLRVWLLIAFLAASGILSIGEVTNLFNFIGG